MTCTWPDGTTGATIRSGAFELFAERLRDMAAEASWCPDGVYRPIKQIDVVLLGDVMDQIRSIEWTLEDKVGGRTIRPWDDPDLPRFFEKVEHITNHILTNKENAKSFAILRNLGRAVRIPQRTLHGRPNWKAELISVDVRIHYMVGNHDWFLHLPGEPFDKLRQRVVTTMGLSNSAAPFPYEISESPELEKVFAEHKVFARHGDKFDSINYGADTGRNASSLGDAMVVELFNRFPDQVEEEMRDDLPADLLPALRELANVRPSLLAPSWITGMLTRFNVPQSYEGKVKEIWDDLVTEFLEVDYVRSFDKPFKFDMVDALQGILTFQKILSFDRVSDLLTKIQEKFWNGNVSYLEHALKEESILSQKAKFVVYGHTHHHEVIPLNSAIINGEPFDQLYLNSGTWRPLHELSRYDTRARRFVSYKVMTYTAFYKGDERKGRPFETWSGVLSDSY